MKQRARLLGLVAVLLAASLPLSVLAGHADGGRHRVAHQASGDAFEDAPCPFELPADQEEGSDVACGYLSVPEFSDEPDGRTIELLVVIYESVAARPAAEPLVLLLGGPGQEVASVLAAFSESSPINYLALLERQDVIVLEQRGIGYSNPSLACSFDAVAGNEPDPETMALADSVESYESCAQDLRDDGIDLDAYDTRESAADVDSLRAALGYERVDLLGVSYGSKLALTVMRDFPEAVRSAILASPVPLQANVLAGQIVAFDKALKRLFAACERDAACGEDHPDLDLAFSAAVERLDDAPVEFSVRNPITGDQLDVVIDGDAFIRTVYVSTFVGLLLPFTPAVIHAAADGDFGPLEFIAPFSEAFGVGVSFGANFVYNCNDELAFTDPEEVMSLIDEAGVMPELADGEFAGTYTVFDVCETLDLEPPARRENQPVESDVPALILAGEYDPITPPAYGFLAAETLPNSHVVVLRGLGHDPITTGGECAMSIATEFLADPNVEPDTACTDRLGLVFLG